MRDAGLAPKLHLFVCKNRRPPESSLGPGCGDAGAALFARLKEEVARRQAYASIWVTETACLGVCPKRGATVACYPEQRVLSEVTVDDVGELLEQRGLPSSPTEGAAELEALLEEMEAQQVEKVLTLARRLKPGLTLEDVKNPHDFPELADPDWHYEDGVLTGIQSVLAATRRRSRES